MREKNKKKKSEYEKKNQLQNEIKERKLEALIFIEILKSNIFDITKHIRFIPPFNENEVDKYFLLFEKVAKDLDIPCYYKVF